MMHIMQIHEIAPPIFRSATQFRLLGELYVRPEAEATIGELAARIGSSASSVSREVDRLAEAGLVLSRPEGNRRVVSARMEAPIAEDLRRLLLKSYGPAPVIRRLLDAVNGVFEARIFGSWAARATGRPGPTPNDIDLLVVGDVDPLEVYEVARRATKQLGMEVTPVIRSPEEWARDQTEFARTVRTGPSVDVTPIAAFGDNDG